MIKILNIHGYQGSAENSAYKALKQCEVDIVSPSFDYDTQSPNQVMEMLRKITETDAFDYIVGTSFGGFFATVLAAETHIPVILINPCLLPFLSLPRLGYKGDIDEFIPLFGKIDALDRNTVQCIIGGKDEVLDTHDFTTAFVGGERVRVIPDGHHSGATLPLVSYFEDVLSK